MKTLLSALILFVASFAANAEETKQNPNTHTNGGRFQLIQLSNMRRDQFLLDTQTGQIWSNVCLTGEGADCTSTVWAKEQVEGVNVTKDQMFKQREFLRKQKLNEKTTNE